MASDFKHVPKAHNILSVELPESSGPADFKRARSFALKVPGCPVRNQGQSFRDGQRRQSPRLRIIFFTISEALSCVVAVGKDVSKLERAPWREKERRHKHAPPY